MTSNKLKIPTGVKFIDIKKVRESIKIGSLPNITTYKGHLVNTESGTISHTSMRSKEIRVVRDILGRCTTTTIHASVTIDYAKKYNLVDEEGNFVPFLLDIVDGFIAPRVPCFDFRYSRSAVNLKVRLSSRHPTVIVINDRATHNDLQRKKIKGGAIGVPHLISTDLFNIEKATTMLLYSYTHDGAVELINKFKRHCDYPENVYIYSDYHYSDAHAESMLNISHSTNTKIACLLTDFQCDFDRNLRNLPTFAQRFKFFKDLVVSRPTAQNQMVDTGANLRMERVLRILGSDTSIIFQD